MIRARSLRCPTKIVNLCRRLGRTPLLGRSGYARWNGRKGAVQTRIRRPSARTLRLLRGRQRLDDTAEDVHFLFLQVRAAEQAAQARHQLLRMLGIEEATFQHRLLEMRVEALDLLMARHFARLSGG